MSRYRALLVLAAVLLLRPAPLPAEQARKPPAPAGPVIVVDTVKGPVEIELDQTDAPVSVARILELVKTNFYRGLRVHHVQPGIVQFGDPSTRNMQRAAEWGFGGSGQRIGVKEITKRAFDRGAVGYAYQADQKPEDADSQMFIIRIANPALNGKYTMLGHVIKGMDVVDKLAVADIIKNVTLKP